MRLSVDHEQRHHHYPTAMESKVLATARWSGGGVRVGKLNLRPSQTCKRIQRKNVFFGTQIRQHPCRSLQLFYNIICLFPYIHRFDSSDVASCDESDALFPVPRGPRPPLPSAATISRHSPPISLSFHTTSIRISRLPSSHPQGREPGCSLTGTMCLPQS